jgi:hypothetical protein
VEPTVVRRMNARMARLVPTLKPRPIPADVEAALGGGVVELGPYLLLRSEAERVRRPPEPSPDATGVEAFLNHVHPDNPGWGPVECAEAAMTALDVLREAVLGYGRSGPVRVVLSVGFHDIPSSSLRFYRRRPDEHWIVDDLESYESEAILVEDIR